MKIDTDEYIFDCTSGYKFYKNSVIMELNMTTGESKEWPGRGRKRKGLYKDEKGARKHFG